MLLVRSRLLLLPPAAIALLVKLLPLHFRHVPIAMRANILLVVEELVSSALRVKILLVVLPPVPIAMRVKLRSVHLRHVTFVPKVKRVLVGLALLVLPENNLLPSVKPPAVLALPVNGPMLPLPLSMALLVALLVQLVKPMLARLL